MANRYVVHAVVPDGAEGEVVAFAQQKRLAFKEQVTFYTDESARQVLFTFTARQVVDLGATYDVRDATGSPLGQFRKDFTASLLRSTWHMRQEGAPTEATGKERSKVVALLRRAWQIIPFVDLVPFAWPYHSTSQRQVSRSCPWRRSSACGTATSWRSHPRISTAAWPWPRPWRWTPSSPAETGELPAQPRFHRRLTE